MCWTCFFLIKIHEFLVAMQLAPSYSTPRFVPIETGSEPREFRVVEMKNGASGGRGNGASTRTPNDIVRVLVRAAHLLYIRTCALIPQSVRVKATGESPVNTQGYSQRGHHFVYPVPEGISRGYHFLYPVLLYKPGARCRAHFCVIGIRNTAIAQQQVVLMVSQCLDVSITGISS